METLSLVATAPQNMEDMQNASPALRKLYQDDNQLYEDQSALYEEVIEIRDFLQTSADRLGMLDTLDSDLRKLEKAVSAAYDAATAAAVVPQARERANKVKDSLGSLKVEVTDARTRMDSIVAKTDPLRQSLESGANKMGTAAKVIDTVNRDVVAKLLDAVAIAAGCVKKVPADKQARAAANLDDAATKLDAVVNEYDRVVRLLLSKPDPWMPSMKLMDPFSPELNAIEKLREDIETLLNNLDGLTQGLNAIAAVMNQSFSFSFPYPNPSWTHPTRFSDKTVSIGFRTIIQGSDAIEREIENILSSFLWGILKGLGVDQYVKCLQDAAEQAVNAAMSKVDFDVNLDLPSMDPLAQFKEDLSALEAAINGLSFPTIDPNLTTFGLPASSGFDFREISAKIKFFNPNGLLPGDPNVCNGVTYCGC